MKRGTMKIGARLALGFGAMLAMMLVLSAIAWTQTDDMERRGADLYQHPLVTRRAIGAFKSDIVSIELAMKDMCLDVDEAAIAADLQTIAALRADGLAQLASLRTSYLGDPADIERAADTFARWDSVRDETLRLLRAGKAKEAVARTRNGGAGGELVASLLLDTAKVETTARNKADSLYADLIAAKQALNVQLLILAAIVLALALAVALALARGIQRPMSELTSAARRFKEGERGARSSWSSGDEFGLLSTAFNDLARTIEAELELGAASAAISATMLGEEDAHRFSRDLLGALLEHTGSQLGAVYLLDGSKEHFEYFEGIGLDAKACLPFSVGALEGEFGPALAGGALRRITDIPEDSRFVFRTVSGGFLPREIVTMPLVMGGEVKSVVSLASLKAFDQKDLRLLEGLVPALSARMDGVLAYRGLSEFSRRLEEQNGELEAQKSELTAQTRELSQQNIELEAQKRELDEANRLKTSFLSTMSHELRTPLNSVIALSGVLGRRLAGKVAEEERGYLEVIERNGRELLAQINDILDLARVESGREDLTIESFAPEDFISDVVETLLPQAAQKGIGLETETGEQLPRMESDFGKCLHILQNIVANAVKFTERGGVRVAAAIEGGRLRVDVVDTGIGIAASDLEAIFDEFRQADSSASRRYGGTGLGLAIAKKYAALLGGDISVTSSLGEGSTFTIHLPLRAPGAGQSAGPAHSSEADRSSGKGASVGRMPAKSQGDILVVEDSEAAVIQLRDILESQGYVIRVARDGEEALAQLALSAPEAMILDLMMPGVDGFEVLRRVREAEATERLPVIILTAKYVTKDELAFLKHNHVKQVLRKGDIDRKQLLEAVGRLLEREAEDEPAVATGDAPSETTADRDGGTDEVSAEARGLPLILVVEDNADNLLTIKALLRARATVVEAADGGAGVEVARRSRPDLVLMDIEMPGVNGIDALREMRRDEALRSIPIVAVTARAMKGDRERFLAMGFDGYLSKPVDELALADVVAQLSRRPREAK